MVKTWQDEIRDNPAVVVAGESDPQRLWVPMQIQALVFGQKGTAKFLNLTPNYGSLRVRTRSAPLGHQLQQELRELFNESDSLPLNKSDSQPPGIHLHWTLPAALTHIRPAAAADGSAPELPLVPNRWMVIRLWEEGGKLLHKSSVIDSDFRDARQGTSPWLEKTGQRFAVTQLGRSQPLENWTRPQPAQTLPPETPLTAFAPGNLAFAAFYPSCESVFGFHDEAADLDKALSRVKAAGGTVFSCSYLVAGWFADRANDPLNVRRPRREEENEEKQEEKRVNRNLEEKERWLKRWLRRMGQLQWAIPGDAKVLPTAVTCYGIISHIEWDGRPCNGPVPPAVTVALGNSVTEAAAVLANRTATANGQRLLGEVLLSELQYATLAERRPSYVEAKHRHFLQNMSRLSGARSRVHERGFSPRDGGLSWEIVLQANGAGAEDANPQPLPRLTKDIADKLRRLNCAQREHDEVARILVRLRQRLFAVWYQQQYRNSNTAAGTRPTLTDEQKQQLLQAIATCKGSVDNARQQRNTKLAACQTAKTELDKALERENALRKDMRKASLVAHAMPQFWHANDPFVLMEGLPAPAPAASPLPCRISDRPITDLELRDPTAGTIRVGRDGVKNTRNWDKPWAESVPPAARSDIPSDIEELLFDALFVDPERAKLLARTHFRPTQGDNPREADLEKAETALVGALQNIKQATAANRLTITGLQGPALDSLLAAISRPSAMSWGRPVFMRWRVAWYPYCQDKDLPVSVPAALSSASSRQPSRSVAHWDFGWEEAGRVDYDWRQKPDARQSFPFDGFTVVAANLERGPKVTSEDFAEYKPVFEQMTKPLLGQSLAGLTEAFGMLDTGPQLPPLIVPPGPPRQPVELSVDDEIAARVRRHYSSAPLSRLNQENGESPSFSPLRGGLFSLLRLAVIDSFGRVLTICDDRPDRASSVPKLSRTLRGADNRLALLPPRLVQPARLLPRWLSAWNDNQESLGDLATSPICGFVVHNRLDRSLLIYGTRNDEEAIYGAANGARPPIGKLLGAVQEVEYIGGSGPVRWSTIPAWPIIPAGPTAGTAESPEPRELTETDIPNRHLRNFVNGLLTLEGGALGSPFHTFLDLLERREEAAELPVEQGLQSVLLGRPLALVRASLHLELDGPPLRDETALPADEPPSYLSVKFPVRLGDRRLGPDGLIGYVVDDGSGAAYHKLRLSADEDSYQRDHAHGYFHDQRDVEVQCDPAAAPIKLTLLLDPQPGVHVISGILPASRIRLSQPLVAATLSDLEIPFLVAPFLSEQLSDPASPRHMPLPTNGDKEWTWQFFPDAKQKHLEVDVRVDTESSPSLFANMAMHEGWLSYRPSRAKPPRPNSNGQPQ